MNMQTNNVTKNMNRDADYYAKRLKRMIECKTVSVKGSYDDTEFAKLRQVVRELFPLVHEKAEYKVFSDDCWVYRLSGDSDYSVSGKEKQAHNQSRNIMLIDRKSVV